MEVVTWAESLLFAVVRIETRLRAGGTSLGTAFIVQLFRGDSALPFLVTNKHVIQGAVEGRLFFTRKGVTGPDVGKAIQIDIKDFDSVWDHHPDPEVDVAVLPLGPIIEMLGRGGEAIYFKSFTDRDLPTAEMLADLDAFETVVFCGFPNGLWDELHLLPIFRRGSTASPPNVDFQGKPQFLVDASVFPGSSGSPVVLYNPGFHTDRKGSVVIADRFFLLGIVAAVHFREEDNVITLIPAPASQIPVARSREMIDLGVVFKTRTITETIDLALRRRGIDPSTGLRDRVDD